MRLYGEIIPELKRGDYRPYRCTNHALSHLYHNKQCRPCTLRNISAKDWVSVNCGTIYSESSLSILKFLGLTSGKANNDGFFGHK